MIAQATHLLQMREGSTVLCSAHAQVMNLVTQAAQIACNLYLLADDEEPIRCQACLLAEVNTDPTQLPH